RGSVTRARSRVREGHPGFGDELPVVARGVERELQDAKGVVVAHLAVLDRGHDRVMAPAARAHDELAYAARGIERPAPLLRREALVVVVMATQDDVRVEVVERLP